MPAGDTANGCRHGLGFHVLFLHISTMDLPQGLPRFVKSSTMIPGMSL
jgi:hypothetical protein